MSGLNGELARNHAVEGIKPDQGNVIAQRLNLVALIVLGSFFNAKDATWNHVLLIALFDEYEESRVQSIEIAFKTF